MGGGLQINKTVFNRSCKKAHEDLLIRGKWMSLGQSERVEKTTVDAMPQA
jgi:hypothetical protein